MATSHLIITLIVISTTQAQYGYRTFDALEQENVQCPFNWYRHQDYCYRFIKSPLRNYNDARKICQAYDSDIVSINSLEEHGFLTQQLSKRGQQTDASWWIGVHQSNPGYWTNEVDGTQLVSMIDDVFLPVPQRENDVMTRDYLAYTYAPTLYRWGFQALHGNEYLPFICEAPVGKLAYLIVENRTYEYGKDVKDPERVPRGPYFVKQPRDTTFDLSKRSNLNYVSLKCLAKGYPTPTYEWFKEDFENDRHVSIAIDPITSRRITVSGGDLVIYTPEREIDRGTYHCRASNKYGTIISESVQLNFGYILEFNLKRSGESGNQNWGKAVYCDPPQHYPGVKYYWARDFFPNFVEEDKRVFVSLDGALYFSALETIDRGNYSCNVQSKVSDTGRNGPFFPLRVNPHSNYQQLIFANTFPKVFPEAPIVGEQVRFECVAFGYPVPSYNWTRTGAAIPRKAYAVNYNRVLIIPNVQVEDQGEYVCRATNDRASIINNVILSVQAEPNFTIPLTDRHMDYNADLTWTCEAFGIPDVNYTWFKNGERLSMQTLPLEDKDRYRIQDNVLTIHYLDPKRDNGMYQCKARNQLKARYSSAQLRVLSLKPSFKKHPLESETYASEQGNVTIKCNPEAAPKPKFTWKKDGLVIGSGGRRRILESGNLVISPVSRDDEGLYTCSATNTYGVDESKGRLIVLHKPRLVEYLPPRARLSFRENLSLRCLADTENTLDVAYIWKHNGMTIRDVDQYNSNNRIRTERGYLNVFNVTINDAGEYECEVKAAVGTISSKTFVMIEGPPGPPGGIQVLNVQDTSAQLQWTDGADNGRPIQFYMVQGRTNWNHTWFNITRVLYPKVIDQFTGRKEAIVEAGLTPYSTYEFRLVAVNLLGYGEPSLPSPRFTTPPDVPHRPPTFVGGGGGKIGDLTIKWQPLDQAHQNGLGIHYKIFWRRKRFETEFQSMLLKDYGNIGSFVVQIPAQYFYTEYEVRVQPFNNVGPGPVSPIVTIFSAEDMPQVAPQLVKALSFNSTALNVSWDPIEQTRERIRGKLIGHRLKYWRKDKPEQESVYYLSRSTKPWSLIVGLQPNTYYFVKVMAYNSAGEGPESERYIERTFRKPPQKPPASVNVFAVNPSTVRVVWRYVQPSYDEEPLIGYKIRVWEADQDMSRANDSIVLTGQKLEAYVRHLSPGKRYNMRVLGYSNGGDGRMSSPTLVFQLGDEDQFRSGALSTSVNVLYVIALFAVVFCT